MVRMSAVVLFSLMLLHAVKAKAEEEEGERIGKDVRRGHTFLDVPVVSSISL